MNPIWKCLACEFSAPGTGAGSIEMLNHMKEHKALDQKGDYCLVDADTGEALLDEKGHRLKQVPQAQRLGFISKAPQKLQKQKPADIGTAIKGRTKPIEVDIGYR